jgi:glycosyltransferase involved in cell wall biosynthesis
MQNTPAVSVVVAVYNAEPYLNRCMDSLLNQTLADIEILLINDGSTDISGTLCDEYAQKDPRVKVFHRTNHGLSATRQFGLDHATGTYITHADPDDWLDLDMLEKMYQAAEKEKADIVFCDIIWEYENSSKRIKQQPSSTESSQVLVDLFTYLNGSCCNKLIKVSCIQKYQLKFLDTWNFAEDRLFSLRMLQNPLKVTYAQNVAYHYDQYSNSSSIFRPNTTDRVYKRVSYIQRMREYQTTDSITPGIDAIEVMTAYLAIRTHAYTPDEFFKVFVRLYHVHIFKLPKFDTPFHMRLIVWTAFHINYRTAERLMAFKLWYRRKIKGLNN